MADATGETREPLRVAFDRRLKLEFHGARITSDGGLLAYRELDDALGLTAVAALALTEGRRGKNIRHRLLGLLRQAVYALTTLRERLVKIGARVVRHRRYLVFQLAEVAVPRALFAGILRRIDHRPLPRPDASGPWGGKSRGENCAPRSTRRAEAARIGFRTEVQRLFPAAISRRICPQ